MLSMTAAIRAASSVVSLSSTGHNSYVLLTPYDWDDLDGPLYSQPVGNWWRARRQRTEAVADLALYLMGFESEPYTYDGDTTIRGMVKSGMSKLTRRPPATE
jgi:hypothetical protein